MKLNPPEIGRQVEVWQQDIRIENFGALLDLARYLVDFIGGDAGDFDAWRKLAQLTHYRFGEGHCGENFDVLR